MLISIVTPTLNSERYLRDTMESIWSAPDGTPETVEQIVVDGGSTDRTLEIAAEYPCRVIAGIDTGMYHAINKGLAAATGDIFGYVNSDDRVAPGGFGAIRRSFDRFPEAQWIVGPVVIIDAAGAAVVRLRPPKWLSATRFRALGWNCLPQPSTYFRMGFAREDLGGFDEDFRLAGDYDFFVRALDRSPPVYTTTPLAHFRLHDANMAKDHEAMEAESHAIGSSVAIRPARRVALRWMTKLQVNAANPRWAVGKRLGQVRY